MPNINKVLANVAQTLTDAEKEMARDNIGAGIDHLAIFASNGTWGANTDIPATQYGTGYSLTWPTGGYTITEGSPFETNSGTGVNLNVGTYLINATILIGPYGGSLPTPSEAAVYYYFGGGNNDQNSSELVDFSKCIRSDYSFKKTITLVRHVPNDSSEKRNLYIAIGSTAHLNAQITDINIVRVQ